jgi:hypothetical protein
MSRPSRQSGKNAKTSTTNAVIGDEKPAPLVQQDLVAKGQKTGTGSQEQTSTATQGIGVTGNGEGEAENQIVENPEGPSNRPRGLGTGEVEIGQGPSKAAKTVAGDGTVSRTLVHEGDPVVANEGAEEEVDEGPDEDRSRRGSSPTNGDEENEAKEKILKNKGSDGQEMDKEETGAGENSHLGSAGAHLSVPRLDSEVLSALADRTFFSEEVQNGWVAAIQALDERRLILLPSDTRNEQDEVEKIEYADNEDHSGRRWFNRACSSSGPPPDIRV